MFTTYCVTVFICDYVTLPSFYLSEYDVLSLTIDHLAVTAPTLAAGVHFVQQSLSVPMQPGGEHARMGTHNQLLKLGESLYLEVIAINPHMPAPERARWFALDNLDTNNTARLATWVARSDDIRAAAAESELDLGPVEHMERGDLQWQITIPSDGALQLQGMAPSLIQWQGPHPALKMPDSGCELQCLHVYSEYTTQLDALLSKLNFEGRLLVHRLAAGERGYLSAQINTPNGPRLLGGLS